MLVKVYMYLREPSVAAVHTGAATLNSMYGLRKENGIRDNRGKILYDWEKA